MEVNDNKYLEILNKFIFDMAAVSSNNRQDIKPAIAPVAAFLGIARIRAGFFKSVIEESKSEGNYEDEYVDSGFDEREPLFVREVTRNGYVVTYDVYRYVNSEKWDEIATERIRAFIKILYIFDERNHVMNMIDYLTYHDRELNILNLPYFMKFSTEKINNGVIGKYAACYFNLKRFSIINQQIGRNRATKCIVEYTAGLQRLLSSGEIVCRIGGDNFVTLCYKENIEAVLEYLKGTEIVYDEKKHESIFIASSAGVYRIPDNCTNAADIMDCVSIANSMARNVLGVPYAYYNEELLERIKEVKTIENVFHEAIKNEEFKVFYQPKVSLKDYSLIGAEALCRWVRDGKIISPDKFIPVLEQSRDICVLDMYVLEHVCMDIRQWLDEGKKVVKISINLSRRHMDDYNLLEHLLKIIDKYNIPHKYIEFELTETTTDVNFIDLKRIVFGLQEAGISTSVDDFGMGYSSLNLIRQLPWNVIKIDKSFLYSENGNDKSSQVMLKHVISMTRELGMQCIVEGVETIEHVQLLKENKCFIAQGFYFDRPLPKDQFTERLMALQY